MKNQKFDKPRKKGILNLVLFLLILFELVICIGNVGSEKSSLEYGIEYEKSPLQLKKAVITNREDIRDSYDLYEDEKLYEICLTYENIANYTARFRNELDFETGDRGYSVFTIYPEGSSSIGRESVYNQVIPAGKTGCYLVYVAVPADAASIKIAEAEEKLAGTGERLMLKLPSQILGSDSWEAE